jgi:hypothetical protein
VRRDSRSDGDPLGLLVNGVIALGLSLIAWELTGSFWGWLILFVPGAGLVIVGLIKVLRELLGL